MFKNNRSKRRDVSYSFIKYCHSPIFDKRFVPEHYELFDSCVLLHKPETKENSISNTDEVISNTPHYIRRLYQNVVTNEFFFELKYKNPATMNVFTGIFPESAQHSLLAFQRIFIETGLLIPAIDTQAGRIRVYRYLQACFKEARTKHRLEITYFVEKSQIETSQELLAIFKSKNIRVQELDSSSIFKAQTVWSL